MSTTIEAGKPISAEDAQKYMDTYLPLKDCLRKTILQNVTERAVLQDSKFEPTKKLFESNINAFLFSKETVMRFFENGNDAKYLMVILGAKFQPDESSNPTVVLTGVNQDDSNPNVFHTLEMKDPATEQPPRLALPEFPRSGFTKAPPQNTIKFTIL